jgi:AraC family transcriptional regulator, regulatory protein of adaptative response / DNA-3-methyladenine glycosylase II
MDFDPDVCYRIIQARDARFDGKFFAAVVSTGVYCRPICPARTPKRENVRFFLCAASAEAAGFRPCKRCRPETAPGTPAWNGTSTTVNTALRLVGTGFLDEHSVGELADRLGLGERHVRRLFVEQLGVAPNAIAQSRRAHFAARILHETDLAVTHVALSAGFGSIRQFNDVFRGVFGEPPGNYRKLRGSFSLRHRTTAHRGRQSITLSLSYRPPYAWEHVLAFLRKRAIPGVEETTDSSYRRSISIGRATGTLAVQPAARGRNQLDVSLLGIEPAMLGHVVRRIRRMFDLDADPLTIAGHLSKDVRLARVVSAFPGMRLPLTWDPFEAVVRAVVGQQISVSGAVTIVGRLAERCGQRIDGGGAITRVFPTPRSLLRADFSGMGVPTLRTRCLVGVARAIVAKKLRLDGSVPPEKLELELRSIAGIGPWSARYVALRGLGEPDAFPESDLGIAKALDALGYPADRRLRKTQIDQLCPWRGYAAIYLWQALAQGG